MVKHLNPKPQKPKRVVILGSRGFLGKKLCAALEKEKVEVKGISSANADLTSPSSVEILQKIFHPEDSLIFASAITPDKGKDTRTQIKNLLMAEHVAAALEKAPVAHVIYISSDAVYSDDLPPITEKTPASPPSIYGLMHLMREKTVGSGVEKGKAPYLVFRPCPFYGAGDTHNSYGPNRFLRSAVKEKKIKLFGKGEEKRPHLYVEDFVAVICHALFQKTSGLANVAPGESVSFGELAQKAAHLAGNGVAIENLPRSGPVTHKFFDSTLMLGAFPGIYWTSLETGLREFLRTEI